MNWGTFIVLIIVVAVVAAVIIAMKRDRDKGICSGSCGSCNGCACGRKKKK